jgi:hypothetical protein
MVAVRVLDPVVPTIARPGKVASPATADLVALPEIVALETVKTIDEVFPVMTLLLASLTRTTTSEITVAFAALAWTSNSRLSTAPGVRAIAEVAEEIPAVVLVKVKV